MGVNHSKQSNCFNIPSIETNFLPFIIKIPIHHQFQVHNKFFEDESISLARLIFIFPSQKVPVLHK